MIDSVWRPEQRGFHAEVALEKQFGEVQLEFAAAIRRCFEFRMRECVIADLFALAYSRFTMPRILIRGFPDDEKSRRRIFLFRGCREFSGSTSQSGPSSNVSATFLSAAPICSMRQESG